MNEENNRDINFIALELTKIRYQKDNLPSSIIINDKTIFDTYKEYTLSLCDFHRDLTNVLELQEENETLKMALQKIEEELNNPSVVDKKKEKLITTINANRGNMEPWLANELIDIINIDN